MVNKSLVYSVYQLIILSSFEIGIGLVTNNTFVTQEGVRWLCNYYQFRNDPYRIYSAVMSSGKEINCFASGSQMKYIARTIRLMDAMVANTRKESGENNGSQANEDEIRELNDAILAMDVDPTTINEQDYRRYYHIPEQLRHPYNTEMAVRKPKHANPVILSIFAQIMASTRNHITATCKYFIY